ncbi:unnamed protein product [Ilex paraguariensis]|uniref:Uncharacterized protein n=1 Tax=Ilex paraguariensis TaxID=185542 RepID=A0ABC8SIU1_9AQUA
MSSTESSLATAKTVVTTLGSIAATAMVVRTFARDYAPEELQDYLSLGLRNLFNRFSNQLTMVIDEFDGLVNNEIYEAAETYLGPKITPNTRRLKISKPEKEKNINITMERNEEVTDVYEGTKFKWVWVCKQMETRNPRHFYNPRDLNSTLRHEIRSFELMFHRKHKDIVVNFYLPYIMEEAKKKQQEQRTLKIFTADYEDMYDLSNIWTSVNLDHPSTFETLAMDLKQKEMVLKDLERFVKRKEYYRKVGKAWKRGYLLYGPPGTGKSSFIAAMANFLNFDVYDLELTELKRNSDLRKLLLATANRSILVVEDIDCTIEFQDRAAKKKKKKKKSESEDEEESKVSSSVLFFWTLFSL